MWQGLSGLSAFNIPSNTLTDYDLLEEKDLQCHIHSVNENEQLLTTESKVSNLGLTGCQEALAAEGTNASCKHCVMSIFHLPPQHP